MKIQKNTYITDVGLVLSVNPPLALTEHLFYYGQELLNEEYIESLPENSVIPITSKILNQVLSDLCDAHLDTNEAIRELDRIESIESLEENSIGIKAGDIYVREDIILSIQPTSDIMSSFGKFQIKMLSEFKMGDIEACITYTYINDKISNDDIKIEADKEAIFSSMRESLINTRKNLYKTIKQVIAIEL